MLKVEAAHRVVKSTDCLVSNSQLLCLAFLYGWRFLNKISLDWLLTLTTQPSTSKLSDKPQLTMWEDYERYQAVKFYKSPPKRQTPTWSSTGMQIPTSLRTVKYLLGEECNMFSIVGDFDSKLVKNDFFTPF